MARHLRTLVRALGYAAICIGGAVIAIALTMLLGLLDPAGMQ